MSESAQQKAATALLERRVRVVKADENGVVIEATSSLWHTRYVATAGTDEIGRFRTCTCPNGRHHPVAPRCWHAEVAALLLGRDDSSSR